MTKTNQLNATCMLPALALIGLTAAFVLPVRAETGKKAVLPLVIYRAGAQGSLPYVPAGYMGNTSAIKMDPASTVQPHSGKTCLKVEYTAKDQWGGVVWQHPANDWGSKPGGWNLTGAKQLSFWARGAKGGETVSFSFGLIGKDKPHHDSGSGKLDKAVLTTAWKHYTISLAGKNLTQIKTGYAWVAASTGAPITFYLDDIEYK
ncbi:MAG: hypothetical protein ACRYFS_12855 [Janthinobacterium lividum]